MENYVPKGYTFPDQDWWEEKKSDVSFLYVDDDDTLSEGTPRCMKKIDEDWEGTSETEAHDERQDVMSERHLSRDALMENTKDPSKMQLGTWIEESRQEMKVTSRSAGITTLAGYVNLAYPIMSSLNKRKTKGYRSKTETNTKDLQKQTQQVSANLQHVSATLNKIHAALNRGTHFQQQGQHSEDLKRAFLVKTTRMVEKCELINVLMNMVKNAARIPTARKDASDIKRTFGSSVDLI